MGAAILGKDETTIYILGIGGFHPPTEDFTHPTISSFSIGHSSSNTTCVMGLFKYIIALPNMKTVLRYSLLVATWIFTLVVIIRLSLAKSLYPPTWIIALLFVMSVIPLAARLKIGNWFDFTKRIEKLNTNVNTMNERIHDLTSQVSTLTTVVRTSIINKQSQQQIVMQPSFAEELAKFFQSVPLQQQATYSPSSAQGGKQEDLEKIYFLSLVDGVIAEANWPFRLCYAYCVRLFENRSVKPDEVIEPPLTSIIEKLKPYLPRLQPAIPDLRYTLLQQIDFLALLLVLQQDVANGKSPVPSTDVGIKLIYDSRRTIAIAVAIVGSIVEAYAQLVKLPPSA